MARGYDPAQPRDRGGEWTSGAGAVRSHFTPARTAAAPKPAAPKPAAARAARPARPNGPPQMPSRPAARPAARPAPAGENADDRAGRLSSQAFRQGDSSQDALQAHRDAAKALRAAAKVTNSASREQALRAAADLHSKVASMKMASTAAEDRASALPT